MAQIVPKDPILDHFFPVVGWSWTSLPYKSSLVEHLTHPPTSNWGVHPKYLIWIYNAIIKPILLHGVIVWWKFSQSENNQKYISRLNRLASLTLSNFFSTTSTAALQRLLDITPLHLVIQSTAMSTCHRLILNNLWESKHVQGNNEIFQSLTSVIPQALMPSDSIPRCLSFGVTNVKFVKIGRASCRERV